MRKKKRVENGRELLLAFVIETDTERIIMAYRRRQVVTRSSTFKEEINTNGGQELLDNSDEQDGSNTAPPLLNSITSSSSSSNNSLAAQAIKASATRRDPSHSLAFTANSSLAQHDHHHRSKVLLSFSILFLKNKIKYCSCIIYHHNLTTKFACTYIQSLDSFGDASGDASKSGFWGVLAQKAKEILEDDNPSAQSHDNDITSAQKLRSQSFNTTYIPGARAQVN
jgi:predicted transcriptional regulator